MRKALKSEQEKAEIEAAERTDRRKGGFEMAKIRDRGWGKLANGVVMEWHVDREPVEYEVRTIVPDNHFYLVIDGKGTLFDAEEFRRFLRWA